MDYDPNALKIYIDGSCLKNPGGRGGIAGIVEYPDKMESDTETIFGRGFLKTTNNRMELRACIYAFDYIAKSRDRFKGLRKIIEKKINKDFENI